MDHFEENVYEDCWDWERTEDLVALLEEFNIRANEDTKAMGIGYLFSHSTPLGDVGLGDSVQEEEVGDLESQMSELESKIQKSVCNKEAHYHESQDV